MSFHRWLTGAFLLFLMIFALGANAILFSARSFQHNLVQVDRSSGGILDLEKLAATEEKIINIEDSVAAQRGATIQAQEAAQAAQAELDKARNAVDASYVALDQSVAALEAKYDIVGQVSAAYDSAEMAQRLERLGLVPKLTAEQRAQVVAFKDAASKLDALNDAYLDKQLAADRAKSAAERAGESVLDADRQILGLKAQFGDNYDRIHNEAEALQRGSIYGIGAMLVGMHPTYLSTLLVCLMGGLGGILFLFPAYVANRFPVTFVVIIVRLVFGMVTALAFYIVANATLAGFAFMPGQETQTTSMSLNPFTVSLLGIIAGVMADDIAEWIHNRGRDILGGGGRSATPLPRASASADSGPPPKGGAVGGATPAPSPVPAGEAMGLFGGLDPFGSAAADASVNRIGGAPVGDGPPKGGVVRRG